MARIPEDQIQQLKAEVSLVRLIEAKGIELKRHGKDYVGRCPFHDDKTPSLVVTPDKNLWHCMGACNIGGSVIDWVMKCEGISLRHAVELLREQHARLFTPLTGPAPKRGQTAKLPSTIALGEDDQTVLQHVVEFYHTTLNGSAEALQYLTLRGINDANLIAHFKLGYANRTLGFRLPGSQWKDGAQLRAHLQKLGVYRESGHEHLSGSLVVPLFNERGDVVQLYGRKLLGNRLRPGTPIHLYLPGDHAGIFNAECLKDSKEIILCEALIDALTFWVHGYHNVTSVYGVNGFTDEMLAAFKTHKIERVLIAFDRDEAGDKAADELAKKLMAIGIDCFRVLFPKGMDANEYALKVKPASKALGVALRKAEWMGAAQGRANVAGAGCTGATQGVAPERTTIVIEDDEIPVKASNGGATKTSHAAPTENLPSLAAPVMDGETKTTSVETATPLPEIKPPTLNVETKDGDIHITFDTRRYRIRGHDKNTTPESLKINLLAANDNGLHVDTLDLYNAKARYAFIKTAALELHDSEIAIKNDLGQLLLHLEGVHQERLTAITTPNPKAAVTINPDDEAKALGLLQTPDLLQRVLNDLHTCGIVGEETNKLTAYLACVSRKLSKPLAIIIQSTSAAGKSSLLDAVLNLIPEEERVHYSAMTGQSLFYMGETNLKHKILAIAEEEGAHRAAYALKLLQSDGSLTIASTGKDATTGNLITQEYRVEGPVMIALTTTAIEIDEELLNRCVVLTVNESREQTRAIHQLQRQRQTLAGLLDDAKRNDLIALHRNAQRLLKPLAVVNPFAEQLTFLDSQTRTRRDHMKYLTLIQSIALLHQYQREVKTVQHGDKLIEYIEVTRDDIAMANKLAHEVLGRTLDELPPQTRKLLTLIDEMVVQRCTEQVMKVCDFRFSRRELRDHTQWGDTQLKVHVQRLVDMELINAHRGKHAQALVYELAWDGQGNDGEHFMMGLIDVEILSVAPAHPCARDTEASCLAYDANRSGQNVNRSALGRGPVGGVSATGRGVEIEKNHEKNSIECDLSDEIDENAKIQNKNNTASYRSGIAAKAR